MSEFLLIELMDATWVNEIYKGHMGYLIPAYIKEFHTAHSIFNTTYVDQLEDKKRIFAKVYEKVNRMEKNLKFNLELLALTDLNNY